MDYRLLAKEVSAKIANQGAEGEVFIQTGAESNIQVFGGKVEKLSRSGSKGMGVRVIRDGKMGYAYTSDFSPEEIEKTWRAAVDLVDVADADEFRALPDPQEIPEEDLKIFDPEILKLSTDEKIAFALAVEKAALDYDERIAMTQICTYLDGQEAVYLANSRGFEGSYQKTFVASYLGALARDGDQSSMAYGIGASSFFKELNAEQIGQDAARKALSMLGGKPVPTQTTTVVFDPICASEIIYYLSQALTAESMQRKRSFLLDKRGQEVAADLVSLLDNGRLPGGLDTKPFDAEGVPTRATRLIDEGILEAVVYDTYTARKDGKQSTGNATRGSHRSVPGLAISNFYLQPGNQAPEEIIAGVQDGFYVLNTMNVGGINPVAGEYSVGASGLWIKHGKLTDPVAEVTVAMPFAELLKHISVVGNDLTFVPFFGSIGAPTIRVDDMVVSGKEG